MVAAKRTAREETEPVPACVPGEYVGGGGRARGVCDVVVKQPARTRKNLVPVGTTYFTARFSLIGFLN